MWRSTNRNAPRLASPPLEAYISLINGVEKQVKFRSFVFSMDAAYYTNSAGILFGLVEETF